MKFINCLFDLFFCELSFLSFIFIESSDENIHNIFEHFFFWQFIEKCESYFVLNLFSIGGEMYFVEKGHDDCSKQIYLLVKEQLNLICFFNLALDIANPNWS